jgi:hypothetical protein
MKTEHFVHPAAKASAGTSAWPSMARLLRTQTHRTAIKGDLPRQVNNDELTANRGGREGPESCRVDDVQLAPKRDYSLIAAAASIRL